MKKIFKKLLGPVLTRLASKASAPDRNEVFKSLSKLLRSLKERPGKRGVALDVDFSIDKFIIFSDHHKGNKSPGDDFASNEKNYLDALDYYFSNQFHYINLGDSEELWKYTPEEVISKNVQSLQSEARFHVAKKYFKTFGNHDLTWKDKLEVTKWFKDIFKLPLPVYEGVLLKTKIEGKPLTFFLTHGHQGDKMSDNNGFSTWLVSHIWRPFQRYLRLNVNTPAKDFELRDRHNIIMYEWSSHKKNLVLITGHTHKPVFAAGLYSDHPNNRINEKKIEKNAEKTKRKPSYFNSGCCCYNDGDITGIEIADGKISLVKWHWENNTAQRVVLEEVELTKITDEL
ncbi:MAG: metallophosphoesterase [Ginsengibacter sp.]